MTKTLGGIPTNTTSAEILEQIATLTAVIQSMMKRVIRRVFPALLEWGAPDGRNEHYFEVNQREQAKLLSTKLSLAALCYAVLASAMIQALVKSLQA